MVVNNENRYSGGAKGFPEGGMDGVGRLGADCHASHVDLGYATAEPDLACMWGSNAVGRLLLCVYSNTLLLF